MPGTDCAVAPDQRLRSVVILRLDERLRWGVILRRGLAPECTVRLASMITVRRRTQQP